MPRHQAPRSTPQAVRDMSARIYDEERERPAAPGPAPHREITWSFYGAPQAVEGPRWSHPDGALLVGIVARLSSPGSGPTTCSIRRNGAQVASITLAAGSHLSEAHLAGIGCSRDDFLTVAAVTVGAGAETLSVQLLFR